MTTHNVIDHGAAGDGQSDDTAAIQDAIDSASRGDSVYFPAGEYRIAHENKQRDNGQILTISGDSHPDNLTLYGDGRDSVITLDDGHDSHMQMIRVVVGDGIEGLRFADLVLDGNKHNQQVSDGVGHGILIRDATSAAAGSVDIRHENIEIVDTIGTAFSTNNGGVVYEQCTARDAERHGFSPDNDSSGVEEPPTEIIRCLAADCGQSGGYYGFDFSGGKGVLSESVAVGCDNGTKVTPETSEMAYHRVRIAETVNTGFMRPDTGGDCLVLWDDVVISDSGQLSIRAKADDTHEIVDGSELLCTGNSSNGNVDVWFDTGASLDAPDGTLTITDSTASTLFQWDSTGTGNLGTYADDSGGDVSANSNLSITTESDASSSHTDIEGVPTADEVGAFVNGEPETRPEPDPNGNASSGRTFRDQSRAIRAQIAVTLGF